MAGASGKMKRTPGVGARPSSGTTGTKSEPSAPRPCNQITENCGFGADSISMAGNKSSTEFSSVPIRNIRLHCGRTPGVLQAGWPKYPWPFDDEQVYATAPPERL